MKTILIALVTLCFCQVVGGQVRQLPGEQIYRRLHVEAFSHGSENAYYPTLVQEKLEWIRVESFAGRLIIIHAERFSNASASTIMASDITVDGKKRIVVSLESIRVSSATLTTKELKTHYALAMTHEAIHFEAYETIRLGRKATPNQRVNEEVRTWHRWIIGAVRPLLQTGHKMSPGLKEVNEVLKRCGDDARCVEFVMEINMRTVQLK
ncbi:MAG: hypothetical protein EXS47_00015 [Candidatus Zambryskibacteria bacterium]|nr:hypothetical protein [Candidatus Zambryskibacteria bacterium]